MVPLKQKRLKEKSQKCELSRREKKAISLVVAGNRNLVVDILHYGRHMVDAEDLLVASVLSLTLATSCTHSSTLVVVAVASVRDLFAGRASTMSVEKSLEPLA